MSLSDFPVGNYWMRSPGGPKHDLIAVRTSDPREQIWPAVGLVQLEDAETGRQVLIDTGSRRVPRLLRGRSTERRIAFTRLADRLK